MSFVCTCGVFLMLLDKPCANSLIRTIASFSPYNSSFPKAVPEMWFEVALLLLHLKIQ